MAVPTGAIPLHPEPTDDPQTLRWVAPLDRVPFAGLIDSAPGFAELHDVVSRLEAVPGSVLVTLAEGCSWRREGERIRQALIAALSHPERWVPGEGAVVLDADGVLRSVAEELLEGPIGQIAPSTADRFSSWMPGMASSQCGCTARAAAAQQHPSPCTSASSATSPAASPASSASSTQTHKSQERR